MDWSLILAGAALVAALVALLYAWAGFRAITNEVSRQAAITNDIGLAVVDMAEAAAKMREIDATLSDHVQWHVAQRMTNSISLLRDIEQTTDMDRERC